MTHIVTNNAMPYNPYIPTPSYDAVPPVPGTVRYVNQELQVFNGNFWENIVGAVSTIGLTGYAAGAIDWAIAEMTKSNALVVLAQTHPAIKAAVDQVTRATEQLRTTIILSTNE